MGHDLPPSQFPRFWMPWCRTCNPPTRHPPTAPNESPEHSQPWQAQQLHRPVRPGAAVSHRPRAQALRNRHHGCALVPGRGPVDRVRTQLAESARGKPQVAIAHFTIPCETPNLIESKSFKLYLNSFNGTPHGRRQRGARALARRPDRSRLARRCCPGSSVGVRLLGPEQFDQEPVHELDGLSLDRWMWNARSTRLRPNC